MKENPHWFALKLFLAVVGLCIGSLLAVVVAFGLMWFVYHFIWSPLPEALHVPFWVCLGLMFLYWICWQIAVEQYEADDDWEARVERALSAADREALEILERNAVCKNRVASP